tara:strand:- start:562 stop:780 length:219 start_codon:yes stop_codon:yes gene_type:complete
MLATEFYNWAYGNQRDFKWETHDSIVRDFCATATVKTVMRQFSTAGEIYDEITVVNFPDGSIARFNYKGEGE